MLLLSLSLFDALIIIHNTSQCFYYAKSGTLRTMFGVKTNEVIVTFLACGQRGFYAFVTDNLSLSYFSF